MKKLTLLFFLFTLLVLAGCTKGPSPNLCASVCNGLVAYYPFYGDATDKSGNGLDGKVTGAGRMASCIKCHRDADNDRRFGLR